MRAWFEPLRLAQRKAQYGRRRATSRSFAYAGKGRQTRQIIQRNHSWHRLPLLVIGGHASTDAPHGSSSEHLLPRWATAARLLYTAHATGGVGAYVRTCATPCRRSTVVVGSTVSTTGPTMASPRMCHRAALSPSTVNVAMAWRYDTADRMRANLGIGRKYHVLDIEC